MITEEDEETHGSLSVISKEVTAAMIYESTFKVDKLTICLSSKLARTTISLCLSKDGESFPISGFPRHLGSEVLQDGRLRRTDDYAAKQAPSQAAAKSRYTRINEGGRNASNKGSMDSSTMDLSNQSPSSSESLPLQYAEEGIPFWARGFRRPLPNTREDSMGLTGTTSSNTETVADTYCDSPINSALGGFCTASETITPTQLSNIHVQTRKHTEGKPAQVGPSPGTPLEGWNAADQRPQMREYQSKSDSRVHQTISRGSTCQRDVSPTPHPNTCKNRAHRPRSLQHPPSYSIFESENLPPMRTATGYTSMGNLNFDDQLAQQDMDDSILDSGLRARTENMTENMAEREMIELAKQENSTTSRAPTCKSPLPLEISIPTNAPLNPVPQSVTSPRSFKNIAYTRPHEGEDMPRAVPPGSPTLYHCMLSHGMRRREDLIPHSELSGWQSSQGREDPPPVPFIRPCDITDMTEEEIFQVAKMRSMNIY